MRDQKWLEQFFRSIWREHFSDVKEETPVKIVFGRNTKNRLGSLKFEPKKKQSLLRVNGLFRYEDVPEIVIKATIVHEMCHYAHGFHSHLPQKHKYPHSGGVIRAEFKERGLEDLYLQQKKWLKNNWKDIVQQYLPHMVKKKRRRRLIKSSNFFR
ncbi:MAG: hypothetical protein WDZ81_00650 [Candidatus Saccharimonadales bacterium]